MNFFEIKNLETYQAAYAASVENPKKFWAELAKNNFLWKRPWDVVFKHDFSVPKISWFEGAQLNITETVSIATWIKTGIKPLFCLNQMTQMQLQNTLHIPNCTAV